MISTIIHFEKCLLVPNAFFFRHKVKPKDNKLLRLHLGKCCVVRWATKREFGAWMTFNCQRFSVYSKHPNRLTCTIPWVQFTSYQAHYTICMYIVHGLRYSGSISTCFYKTNAIINFHETPINIRIPILCQKKLNYVPSFIRHQTAAAAQSHETNDTIRFWVFDFKLYVCALFRYANVDVE